MTQNQIRTTVSAFLVAVGLAIAWLWWQSFDVAFQNVEDTLGAIRWEGMLAIGLLLVLHVGLSALRWSVIEQCLGGPRPSLRLGFLSGAVALGLGVFLPAPVMNVACRAVANKLAGTSGGRGAVSGSIDQLSDFAMFVWMAMPAALAIFMQAPEVYVWLALMMGILLSPLIWLFSLVHSRLVNLVWFAERVWLLRLLSRKALLQIYLLSALRFFNITLITLIVGNTIGFADDVALGIAVPLVSVANALVMLPGAIGVAEWSFSAVLGQLGIAQVEIVRFVIANRLILTAVPIVVAIFGSLVSALVQTQRSKGVRSFPGNGMP